MKHLILSEFIKKDLNPNLSQTAFLLGNGINNHCETTSSWKNLLIDLAHKHIDNRNDFKKILEDNSVSYPEFFDLIQLSRKNKFIPIDYKSIKKSISDGFKIWMPQPTHTIWTEKMIELNRPVLTTNFDFLLELSTLQIKDFILKKQSDNKRFTPLSIKNKGGKREFNDFYPWRSYYSNKEIANSNNEFAIWHIHGFCDYSRSIRLGLSDYMGVVEKARKLLFKSDGNPFNKRENLNNWVGHNTWLDIFLNNNLIIIGIGLDVQETSLRWLLLEKEKLFCKYPSIRKKTWFILNKQYDRMEHGKQLFFEKLNIEIIHAEDSKQVYETIPKLLK